MNNRFNTAESEGLASARRLMRHARTLYSVPDVPASTNKHNRKQWVRSVALLGDKWLLAVPRSRVEQ